MTARTTTRRDPEGRRRAIVQAAVELVAESGVGRITHRRIASRAGVPLGSTTYYFPSLDDLLASAMEEAADLCLAELAVWRAELQASDDPVEALVRQVQRYLEDRSQALLEYELYLAAARSTEVRSFARVWIDGLRDLLAPVVGAEAAGAVAAMVDGAIVQALVTGELLDAAGLREGIRRLMR